MAGDETASLTAFVKTLRFVREDLQLHHESHKLFTTSGGHQNYGQSLVLKFGIFLN
jgi:hypothetical protein